MVKVAVDSQLNPSFAPCLSRVSCHTPSTDWQNPRHLCDLILKKYVQRCLNEMRKIFLVTGILISVLCLKAQYHYPIPRIKWTPELEEAAKAGNIEAQRNLGICIIYSLGIDRDDNEAFPWFEKAAKKGDAEAQTYVGDFYYGEFGDLFEDKEKDAFKWYKKASDQKFPEGIYLLSQCYLLGDGVKENENKYLELLKEAAELDNGNACYDLAMEYKKGKLLQTDMDKYYYYLTKAADAEILNACTTMGKAYYQGEGVPVNYDKAFKYLQNAVKYIEKYNSGYGWLGEGAKMLSSCYRFGRGCKIDEDKADKYLLIASEIEKTKSNKDSDIIDVLKALDLSIEKIEDYGKE